MSNIHRDAPTEGRPGAPASVRPASTSAAAAVDRSSPNTQFSLDRDDYLGETEVDVGRKTSASEYELFVSCNPAPAMQQQFEHLRPEFIAVHDIGTSSSRRLLGGLAAATGVATQKLVIRRQGYGTALATVHFVELASTSGTKVRVYSTDCDTEPSWRQSLSHMLLAFSRLGAIMVGDLKDAEIATVTGRLRDSIARGPWHSNQLLLLPLGSASSLVTHGMELARGTNLNVRTTPQVARAADAWGFISSTWNRLTEKTAQGGGSGSALARLTNPTRRPTAARAVERPFAETMPATRPAAPPAMPRPAAAAPSPVVPRPAAGPSATVPGALDGLHAQARRSAPEPQDQSPERPNAATVAVASVTLSQPATADVLRRYVRQVSELTGVVGCTVLDVANGNRVAYAGSGPSAADLAASGAELMSAILKVAGALNLGRSLPEAAITLESHHLILRAVPRHAGLALHVVLDKGKANLTLVRLQVLRLDGLFEEPATTGF